MNKLWVFGCSFSTGFGGHNYNIEINKTWPKLLADKLNLKLDNSAHAGQCNWVSILQFIDRRDEIQPGDIVIFEFTFFDRFNVYPTRAQLIDLEAFFIEHKHDLNDVMREYKDVNFNWFKKQILKWCVDNKIKLYVWSAEGQTHIEFNRYKDIINFISAPNSTIDTPNYSFYVKWQNDAVDQHIVKENGEIDRHFNELGHDRMANHMYSIIN
jgi:hypothetical protein